MAVITSRFTSRLRDFHPPNLSAGSTLAFYSIFGGLPIYLAVIAQLGLNDRQSASFLLGVYGTSAVFSVLVSFYYRKPFTLTSTLPPVLLIGALADRFTFEEIVGANFVAAGVIIFLGVSGIGRRVIDWIPMPIVMGMFAGSILGFVTRMVQTSADDTVIAEAAIAGYLVGRVIRRSSVPPIALALVFGGIAVVASQRTTTAALEWGLPSFGFPGVTFSVTAIAAITLPVVLMSMVLGNIEASASCERKGMTCP